MKVEDVAGGGETFPRFCLATHFRGFFGIFLLLMEKMLFYKDTSKLKLNNVYWV